MIGMIIVGPMAHDNVSLPLTDQAGDGAAVLQSRQQFAVMNVQHLRGDAENLGGFLNLGGSPSSQGPARLAPVTDVAVGHGHKFNMMSLRGPQGGSPSGLQLAIVRMSAEADDPQFAVVRWNLI